MDMTASPLWWAIGGIVAVGLYAWYASIVRRRIRVLEALAGIDVQLQQRHDLIPNVLTIARKFMDHERGLLAEITELRSRAHQHVGARDFAKVADKFDAETKLGEQMGRLLMLAENYPQLRSDGPMIEAQRTYTEIETNIAATRRFYNASVSALANAVATFPGSLLKGLAGVREIPPFFQTSDPARKSVDAGQYL
jgi:LemA protein